MQLPEKIYVVLETLFDELGFSVADKKSAIEKFEEVLLGEFHIALMRKLPEQERKKLAELANSGGSEEIKNQLQNQLKSWLNDKEVLALYQKVAERVFNDLVQTFYKGADEDRKQKLKALFKPEVLKSV